MFETMKSVAKAETHGIHIRKVKQDARVRTLEQIIDLIKSDDFIFAIGKDECD